MKLRTVLFFIVVGAILRFAVIAHLSWINLRAVGVILMLLGLGGFLLSTYRVMLAAGRRRRERLAALGDLVDQPEPGSALIADEIESAHLLAQEARPYLEAEGFSNQRIDELALAFLANDLGRTRAEFIPWALEQGRLGPDPNVDV